MTTQQVEFASRTQLDTAVAELSHGAQRWAAMDMPERIALLKATHASVGKHAKQWAEAAIAAKSIPAGPLEGEEWLAGPWTTISNYAAVIDSLTKLRDGKSPLDGVSAHHAPGGRVALGMLPNNAYEALMFSGFRADVWLKPGVTESEAHLKAGLGARDLGVTDGVGVVLGAGNVSSIGPLDVLWELVANNRVSILKLNPTFGTLLEAYSAAFAPLIEADMLRIVNGDAEVGAYLTGHPGISHVHITGSGFTHDLIVWGSLTDKSTQVLSKPITSELGGVSPIIVVPGEWSRRDLAFQAEAVATQRLNNAGHNCIAGQALIISEHWDLKDEFLAELAKVYDAAPQRPTWYPGSQPKLAMARRTYPDAHWSGDRALITVTPETSQALYTTEYFAPVLGVTELPGTGADFFAAAVDFANQRLYGTLGASIVVAEKDRKAMGSRFEEILADLHYGIIGVNVWTGFGFTMPYTTWGAFPGNTLSSVGSGIGVVHNARLVDDVERSVLWGPFRPFPRSVFTGQMSLSPRPPWFVTAKTSDRTARALTKFSSKPSWLKMPRVVTNALRG